MPLEFWFEFASTYSYAAAMRIEAEAARAGVEVEWRPFLLGPIFREQGWNDSPFNLFEAKGRYMWRDLERECARLGIPFRRPTVFPRNGLLAARIACQGQQDRWLPAFVRAVFAANFADDREISDPDVMRAIIESLGLPAEALIAGAGDPAVKERLRAQTEHAARIGIFGAPSFVAGDELFWGNDRLEQALEHARAPMEPA